MNTRPTPETDKFFATFADGEAAPSHAEYYARLQDLERERDEARAESIRWMSIAEGRGRTDDDEQLATAESQLASYKARYIKLAGKYAIETHEITAQRDEAREAAEHYRNLYYLPKDGLEAAKNHPLSWENAKAQEELATVTAQRDRLAEALQDLVESCNCIDSVDFMPVSMPEAFEKAQQAIQSLTLKP
jgi:chromosome segregation ATPase